MAATLDDVLAELRTLNANLITLLARPRTVRSDVVTALKRMEQQHVTATVKFDGKEFATIVAHETKRRAR